MRFNRTGSMRLHQPQAPGPFLSQAYNQSPSLLFDPLTKLDQDLDRLMNKISNAKEAQQELQRTRRRGRPKETRYQDDSYSRHNKSQLVASRVHTESSNHQPYATQKLKKPLGQQEQMNRLKELLQKQDKMSRIEQQLSILLEKVKAPSQQMVVTGQGGSQSMPYPQPIIFNPYNWGSPPPPYPGSQQQLPEPQPRNKRSMTERSRMNPYKRQSSIRMRLKRCILAVVFTRFIRHQAKKISTARKNLLRKYWMEKFDEHITLMKNWLLEGLKYSIALILEKASVPINLTEKRQKIRQPMREMLFQILSVICQKIKAECTLKKTSGFMELLSSLCRRNSFLISRFWTTEDLEGVCISPFYGFIRADDALEKYLIGHVVFIKVLIFNMFLQPHKFDPTSFPKDVEPLRTNMWVIGSLLYHLLKESLAAYLAQPRSDHYPLNNWCKVHTSFISEVSQPLKFRCRVPEVNEYISGMAPVYEIEDFIAEPAWFKCRKLIEDTIDALHQHMSIKSTNMKKNLKYKLYN